jgi:hypothetical protein
LRWLKAGWATLTDPIPASFVQHRQKSGFDSAAKVQLFLALPSKIAVGPG